MAAGLGAVTMTQLVSCDNRTGQSPVNYVFADEFDGPAGSAPDPSKWGYDIGGRGLGEQ